MMDELRQLEEELAWLEAEKGEFSQEYRDCLQRYHALRAEVELAWTWRRIRGQERVDASLD